MNAQAIQRINELREQVAQLGPHERFPVWVARVLFTEPRTRRQWQRLLKTGYRGRILKTWDEAGELYTTKAEFYRFRDGFEEAQS